VKLRQLTANSRGLAAAAVAALALGIGITALMFAIVDGTVRRGLPVERAGDVVHLERVPEPGGERRASFTGAERATLEASGALSALAAYRPSQTNVAAPGLSARRWATAVVSPNTFAILGVQAAHGHVFTDAPEAEGVVPVLISDEVWRAQFGGDPATVGRTIHANGVPAVITGIMPPGFRFPFNHHLWTPLDDRAAGGAISLWGRTDLGEEEAESRLTAAYQQQPGARARVGVAPFTRYIQGPLVVQLLEALFVAGLGVLAIACANVANLLLARGLARRRDFAIAAALGASRGRIMRERIAEGLALAAPGVLFGVLLTYAGAWAFTRAIQSSLPPPPYWVSVVVDTRVLLYAIAAATLSALVASALPSLRSGSAAVVSELANESRGTTSGTLRRATAVLIFVEVALASGVLIAAGLMTKGVVRLASTRYDFAVDEVTIGRVSLPARGYPDAARRRRFFDSLFSRLQSIRGTDTALGSSFPFASAESVVFQLDRSPGNTGQARRVVVSPGYFSTLGVGLIGGRDFEAGDNALRGPVAIVNLSFALRHARREDLIGRTIRIGGGSAPPAIIVGVAPDLAVGNPRGEQPEAIYVPLFQQTSPPDAISVLARAESAGVPVERALREAIASIDPELPLDGVMSLGRFREGVTWFYRAFGYLLMAFGIAALALALVGVYAVMAFGVTRRRREIGTRMAFGATGGDIARLFLLEGAWRLAAGLAAGALLAAWLTPRLALILFQVSPRDPYVYGSALLGVTVIGFAACLVPALRAARQDPNECLRE